MRGLAIGLLVALGALALWLWVGNGSGLVNRWAAETQRDVQNAMAGSIRALRAGNTGALVSLWGLCFAYGFVHAAGPGHGKLVIGGYGVAARVAARRLAGLAALSSLAQAVMAIVVVYLAIWILGWGRDQLSDLADNTMAPLSYTLIAGLGLYLVFRGMRKLWRQRRATAVHTHTQDDHHIHTHTHDDGTCSDCGHRHGPSVEEAANVKSLRDALAIVVSIAIRPCTGAIFLLILTHAFGLHFAGVVGVLLMGLGTAAFTAMVAFAAVGARESTLAQIASTQGTARLLAIAETGAGLMIVILALQFLL